MRRALTIAVGVLAVLAVVLVARGGSDDHYVLHAHLEDAGGLRTGSEVTVGGVQVGTVHLALGKDDKVDVRLDIDKDKGPVGRDASFAIASVNLLGQKRVELDPGSPTQPADSGSSIPAARVLKATDLDQVLNVLDATTRDRLKILIDEAGAAFVGRRADVSQMLGELPNSLIDGTKLLRRVSGDNHTLADLVTHADGFVSELTAQRAALARTVDAAGQTMETVAARRAALEQTLRNAPGTLRTIQAFLGDLRDTTVPLGPAARDISATAPELNRTLAAVDPFRKAADPTLKTATQAAPQLTKLAVGATPVLRRAAPTLTQLATTSGDLAPVSDILDHSVDNLLATVENWSHAVQLRDGLSHVFRAEVSLSPDMLDSAVKRLVGTQAAKRTRAQRPAATKPSATVQPAQQPASPLRNVPAIKLPKVDLPKVVNDVTGTLDQVLGSLKPKPKQQQSGSTSDLLDFLLKP